jgi:hypothetical protein
MRCWQPANEAGALQFDSNSWKTGIAHEYLIKLSQHRSIVPCWVQGSYGACKRPDLASFRSVDFISCAWTALLGNQSVTVRTV